MVSNCRTVPLAGIRIQLHRLPIEDAGDSLSTRPTKQVCAYAEWHTLRYPAYNVLPVGKLCLDRWHSSAGTVGQELWLSHHRICQMTCCVERSVLIVASLSAGTSNSDSSSFLFVVVDELYSLDTQSTRLNIPPTTTTTTNRRPPYQQYQAMRFDDITFVFSVEWNFSS